MIITCPLPAELIDITASDCPFKFDQIVRLGFQQRQSATSFANEAAMKVLANWQALQGQSDETKIVMSPLFAGFVIPGSEPLTTGGNDNTTIKGLRTYHGEGSVTATGTFRNLQPQSKVDMSAYSQYSLVNSVGLSNLTIYMVNKDGYIFYTDVSAVLNGIRCYNFRIGNRGSEGLNADDINGFSVDMEDGWDNNLKVVKPSFDPLTEL